LVDERATIYAEPHRTAATVTELAQGDELEISGQTTSDGENWVAVTLDEGRQGYMPGTARVFRYRLVRLDQEATMRAQPSDASDILVYYGPGAALMLVGTTVQDGQTWLEVRDSDGNSGFMPGSTRLEGATPTARANAAAAVAKRNMLVGGLWCGGGLLVTLFTYMAASGGGTYVVAWGAIIFGGWQLLKGISQYLAAGN
jgi:hypothetical protein